MITYIKYRVPLHYVELENELDPELYSDLGETWEDFMANKWVKLSEELIAFRLNNPGASVKEVWNMELQPIPERTIENARALKLQEISSYDNSINVNGFTINELIETWFTVLERLNYKESINAAKLLGNEEVSFFVNDIMLSVNCDLAIGMLALIQNYADACFIVTKLHMIEVRNMETIEEVDAFDVTAGYPDRLNFNLV